MRIDRRYYCDYYADGSRVCYGGGFWYTDKGIIIKWSILAAIFFFFFAWFVGGYFHAIRRLKKGQPLLAYHRWLVPYKQRVRYGQAPQNHFTFYATQQQPYAPRQDGTYPEPPPMYTNDAPPQYMPPLGATKANPSQNYQMNSQFGVHQQPNPAYAMAPMAPQQSGVTGSYPMGPTPSGPAGESSNSNNYQEGQLPPRPERVKVAATNFLSRFRK